MQSYKACLVSAITDPRFAGIKSAHDACVPLLQSSDDITISFPQTYGGASSDVYSVFNVNATKLPTNNIAIQADTLVTVYSSDYWTAGTITVKTPAGNTYTGPYWTQTLAVFRNNLTGRTSADAGYVGNITPIQIETGNVKGLTTLHQGVQVTGVHPRTLWVSVSLYNDAQFNVWIGASPEAPIPGFGPYGTWTGFGGIP